MDDLRSPNADPLAAHPPVGEGIIQGDPITPEPTMRDLHAVLKVIATTLRSVESTLRRELAILERLESRIPSFSLGGLMRKGQGG